MSGMLEDTMLREMSESEELSTSELEPDLNGDDQEEPVYLDPSYQRQSGMSYSPASEPGWTESPKETIEQLSKFAKKRQMKASVPPIAFRMLTAGGLFVMLVAAIGVFLGNSSTFQPVDEILKELSPEEVKQLHERFVTHMQNKGCRNMAKVKRKIKKNRDFEKEFEKVLTEFIVTDLKGKVSLG